MDQDIPVDNAVDAKKDELDSLNDPEERQVVYKAVNSFQ
jgi:hypothetical protein